jgi:hypothetical protein
MPTRTAHMHDEDAGGLIIIVEYGQECIKIDPIQVLYHGFGHYHSLLHPSVHVIVVDCFPIYYKNVFSPCHSKVVFSPLNEGSQMPLNLCYIRIINMKLCKLEYTYQCAIPILCSLICHSDFKNQNC